MCAAEHGTYSIVREKAVSPNHEKKKGYIDLVTRMFESIQGLIPIPLMMKMTSVLFLL